MMVRESGSQSSGGSSSRIVIVVVSGVPIVQPVGGVPKPSHTVSLSQSLSWFVLTLNVSDVPLLIVTLPGTPL